MNDLKKTKSTDCYKDSLFRRLCASVLGLEGACEFVKHNELANVHDCEKCLHVLHANYQILYFSLMNLKNEYIFESKNKGPKEERL